MNITVMNFTSNTRSGMVAATRERAQRLMAQISDVFEVFRLYLLQQTSHNLFRNFPDISNELRVECMVLHVCTYSVKCSKVVGPVDSPV